MRRAPRRGPVAPTIGGRRRAQEERSTVVLTAYPPFGWLRRFEIIGLLAASIQASPSEQKFGLPLILDGLERMAWG